MRLVYVAPDVSLERVTGGTVHVLEVARGLARRGCALLLVVRRDSRRQPRIGTWEGFEVWRVFRGLLFPVAYSGRASGEGAGTGRRWWKDLYLRKLYPRVLERLLVRRLRAFGAEGVVERGACFGAGVRAAKRLGLPAVLEVIDGEFDPGAALLADRVISSTSSRLFPPGVPRDKIVETTAGVRWERFQGLLPMEEAKARLGLRGPVVAYVGGPEPWHGLDLLREAMALVPEATLLIIGSNGPDTARERFLGRLEPERVPEALQAADVAAVPIDPRRSPYPGLGNVYSPIKLFEAMACGLPVVATDVELVSPVVAEHECGLLVPPEPARMAGALRALLADEGLRRRLGENGRKAAARYSWDRVAGQILEAFQGSRR